MTPGLAPPPASAHMTQPPRSASNPRLCSARRSSATSLLRTSTLAVRCDDQRSTRRHARLERRDQGLDVGGTRPVELARNADGVVVVLEERARVIRVAPFTADGARPRRLIGD